MAKLRSHQDLDVYKMAFRAAMDIFELSKQFPKEENIRLLTRYGARLVPFVPTLQKLSAKDSIRRLLSLKYMTQRQKPPKHRYGLIFHRNAIM